MSPNHTPAHHSSRLLQPGRNCWRIEHARRFSMLVDADIYFRTLRQAILKARHSVFILSWDIDNRMRLVPEGANDGYPEPLGDFLYAVADARPDLHIHVLNWDFAMLFALERKWPAARLGWRGHHRQLKFHMDAEHPVGASHHQKIVVIDDALAFAGGLDIARCRWDTPEHAIDSPLRRDSDGKPYAPFHDVQAMVDGDVARALGELARERWERATNQETKAAPVEMPDLWPEDITPDVTDIDVGIARTEPAYKGREGVYEVRQLHLDAIATARQRLFFENQYFTSDLICNALAARLIEDDAPEIMIVMPKTQNGWLEQSTMGVLRARIHRRLKQADARGRYRMYCAELPGLNNDSCLNVHSKVFMVDDDILGVGSANLSNRSMALDTECKLVIEAHGSRQDEIRGAIARLRSRLMGEHLDVKPEQVDAELQRCQSLHETVAALQGSARSLHVFEPATTPDLDALIPDQAILDPEQPIDPDALIEQLVPRDVHQPVPRRMIKLGMMAVALALLAVAWRWTPLGDIVNLAALIKLARSLDALPFTPLAVILGYVVAGLLMVPVSLLIGVTGIVFGPLTGGLYAAAGTLLSAAVSYGVGRWLGNDGVHRLLGGRLGRISRRLSRQGIVAMMITRLLPVAPFTVVNMLAGALRIRFRYYLIGTFLGMAPGIAITVTFAHHLAEAVRYPSTETITVLAGVAILLIGMAAGLQRLLERRNKARM